MGPVGESLAAAEVRCLTFEVGDLVDATIYKGSDSQAYSYWHPRAVPVVVTGVVSDVCTFEHTTTFSSSDTTGALARDTLERATTSLYMILCSYEGEFIILWLTDDDVKAA